MIGRGYSPPKANRAIAEMEMKTASGLEVSRRQNSNDEEGSSKVSETGQTTIQAGVSKDALKVVDSFLDSALGEEHKHYCDDDSSRKEVAVFQPKETSPNNGSKLYYTVSSYRALTQISKRRKRPVVPADFFKQAEEYYTLEEKQKDIEELNREADKQKVILQQVTKALIYCCASTIENVSPVRVECERILLLASRKYTEIMNKVNHLRSELYEENLLYSHTGTVTISDTTFTFNNRALHGVHDEHYIAWTLCIVSHEDRVLATNAVCVDGNKALHSFGEFIFNNLKDSFSINVQIYSLMIKQNLRNQYLKKFLLLPRIRTQESTIESQILSRQAIFKTSDFQLEGSFVIQLSDLKKNIIEKEFPFGSLQMSMKWNVESKIQISGFLTIQEMTEKCHPWDRRWCVLEDSNLKYWNYPTCKDLNMPPLGVLDLRKCKTTEVESLDRKFCPRPRTFLLEMIYGRTETTKYLLSTDTRVELSDWCTLLNRNLALLRTWNTQVKHSDL